MQYEQLITQQICPLSGELNERSSIKLQGYHQLICLVAENELARCGCSIAETLAQDYAWALVSITADVIAPIKDCSVRPARTWSSEVMLPFARREVEVCNADGTTAFNASLFSVPFSVSERAMLRDFDESRMEALASCERILIPDARRRMRYSAEGFVKVCERRVQPSDIDALGHMNNCRYGAYIYDALTPEQRELLDKPFRYVIDFRMQLSPDAAVLIERRDDENEVTVRGTDVESGKVSFTAKLSAL